MQSQLSLFGIFLFIVVQMAASPAFIMWTTPLLRNGFSLWADGSWTGSQEWTWAYLEFQAVLLRRASLWVRFLTSRGRHFTMDGFLSLLEPAVIAEACHIEAKMGLDCHLSHRQQTIKDINSNSYNRSGGSISSKHPLFQILIALFQTMTIQTGHAYHHTSKGTQHLWPTHSARWPQISSVLFFMLSLLKAFS